MKQQLAPIISKNEVMSGVYLIWLECPDIASLARPGQFIMVRCQGETLLRRPISVHQVNESKSRLALLFAAVGKGTKWLAEQQEGERLDIFGPLGNGFSVKPESRNLLLVAGGIGIAPLHFLADMAKSKGHRVHLHQGVNTAGQLILEALSSRYSRVPYSGVPAAATLYGRADIIPCTASTVDGSAGVPGMATVCIPGLADWADQIFACGPMPMYQAMSQMPEAKRKLVQVSLETVMACGFGVCYGCTIKTKTGLKQVCKDGPVFDLEDIVW